MAFDIPGLGYEAPDIWRIGIAAFWVGIPLLSVRRLSTGLLLSCGEFWSVEELLLDTGDLALLADSMNQCLIEANWWKKACWRRRLGRLFDIPFGGARNSGFVETSCSVLLGRERLISLGGRGGRRREELAERERIESFSIGGGATGDLGESRVLISGNRGSSGRIN